MTQELVNVLQEALEIAGTEQIYSVVKSVSPGMVGSLIRLRALSIELLSTSIKREEFNSQKLSPLREDIISMFFKSLWSKIPEIGIVAKESIRQVRSYFLCKLLRYMNLILFLNVFMRLYLNVDIILDYK